MQIDLDPRGRKVVIFGDENGTRQAVRRFVACGATVTLVLPGSTGAPDERVDSVRYAGQPTAEDTAGLLRLIGPAWLIVDVGMPAALCARAFELAGHLHVLMISEPTAPSGGQVTLVGGGPGRSSLLTLEACEALRQADVIFADRLAPTEDLLELAPGAELVDVGKSPYHHPVSQRSIEELMIRRARRGESVVRLKGGDPFVFGRGGEELQACIAAGLPVRVVPGVSSALAVPAACGIPLTHRGISRSFTVISGHIPPDARELDALVRLGGTIVVLMGLANLDQIVAGLCQAGLGVSTPAAAIERGFSSDQRSTMSTVGRLPAEVRRLGLSSPAVVVVGEVVAVAPEFAASVALVETFDFWSATPPARAS